MSSSGQPYGPKPSRLLCPWDSPGKNNGVGCLVLLQRIFPTQRWNPISYVSSLAGGFFIPGPTCLCTHSSGDQISSLVQRTEEGVLHTQEVVHICYRFLYCPLGESSPLRGEVWGCWLQVEKSACENCLFVSLSYTAGEGQAF